MQKLSSGLKTAFVLILLFIIGCGAWFYISQEKLMRRQIEGNLQSIAHLKANQIVNWQKERIADAIMFKEYQLFTEIVGGWLEKPRPDLYKRIMATLLGLNRHDQYDEVLLVTPDGKVHMGVGGKTNKLHHQTLTGLLSAMKNRRVEFVDLHTDSADSEIKTAVIAPLLIGRGDADRPVGAIILVSQADNNFFPLIQTWPVVSQSAETLLVRKDGDFVLYLNELRHRKNTALKLRIPLTEKNIPAVRAVSGHQGFVEDYDYRGVKVIAATLPVSGTPWFIVAKVDEREAFAAWRFRSLMIMALFACIVILAVVASLFVRQRLEKNHYSRLYQAETERRASERRHAITLASIGDGVIVTDTAGIVEMLNPVAEALTGWTQEDAHGRPLEEVFRIVHEDTGEQEENPVIKAVTSGVIVGLANYTLLIARDGTRRPIDDSAAPIRDEAGNISGAVLVFRDRTERKRMEKELLHSKESLELAQKVGGIGAWDWNQETKTDRWTDEMYAVFGLDPKLHKASLKTWLSVLHPEDRAGALHNLETAFNNGTPLFNEYRIILPDGSVRWISTTGKGVYGKDKPLRMIGVCMDVTERKRSEQALRESEEKYRGIFETSTQGIVVADLETRRFVYVNQALCNMLGYVEEEMLKLGVGDIHPPESLDYIYSVFELQAAGLQKQPVEMPCLCKDGTIIYADVVAAPTAFLGRRCNLGFFADVAERRRSAEEKEKLQSQLLQAQKMESIGRLAGGVAHDFNNMLSIILGHAELAKEKIDPDNEIHADLAAIIGAAGRSADLTRQLLAFARKQTVSPKVLDMNDVVAGMLKMLQRLIGENIELAWLPEANIWPVLIDPGQVDQILANLCVNSRDAIKTAGRITIETENVTLNREYCDTHVGYIAGDYVLLSVSDDGCGMDKDTLSHLFEPFFTTKEIGSGTGLGLATIYGIVKQNSGFINVYSEPGYGATFKIYLPRYLGAEKQKPDEAQQASPKKGQGVILLVEDEPTLLNLGQLMLEKLGYTVLPADSPGKGLQLTQEHAGKIDLLITDVVMPEMNGRDLALMVTALQPKIKQLFMSGYTADVIVHSGVLDAGIAFIQKPFSLQELSEKISSILEE